MSRDGWQNVEAIAEGIWFDVADPARPFAQPATHPLAGLDLRLAAERFQSASGIEWELRRADRPDADLVRDSRLCSQRLYQFNLLLDGHNRQVASIWLHGDGLAANWPGTTESPDPATSKSSGRHTSPR